MCPDVIITRYTPTKRVLKGSRGLQRDQTTQVNHPAARRPQEPASSPPQKSAARTSVLAANPGRKLGFHDSPAPAAAPTTASLPVPEAAPAEPVMEVTDTLNEAAALVISSGPEGLKAAKTICSVVNNVLKAPKEAKYRQLNWYVFIPRSQIHE